MEVSTFLAHKKAFNVWSIGPNAMAIDAIQLMDKKNVRARRAVDKAYWLELFPSAITHEKSSWREGPPGKLP